MTFKISPRETLQKCDYNNPFQAHIEQPRLRDARVADAKERDLQETAAAKKERQIMERYLKGYFGTEDLQISALQIIGKMVFFLIIMPPLFVTFTLPKWLYEQIIEKGEELVNVFQNKFNQWVKPVITWIAAEWNLALEKLGMRGKKIAEIFTKGQQHFSKVVERSLSRLKAVATPILSPLQKAQNMISSAAAFFTERAAKFQELLSKARKSVSGLNNLFPRANVDNSMKIGLEKASHFLEKMREKLVRIPGAIGEDLKEIGDGAKVIALFAASLVQRAAENIAGIIIPLTVPFQKLYEASSEKFSLVAATVKSMVHAAQNYIQRFQGFVVLRTQEAVSMLLNFYRPIETRLRNAIVALYKKTKGECASLFRRMAGLGVPFLRRLQRWGEGLQHRFQKSFEEKKNRFIAQVASFKEKVKKSVSTVTAWFNMRANRLFQFFARLTERVVGFARNVHLAFSTFFLIVKVFLKVAFQKAIYLSKKI